MATNKTIFCLKTKWKYICHCMSLYFVLILHDITFNVQKISYYFYEHLYRVSFHSNPRTLNLNFKCKALWLDLSWEFPTRLWMLIIKINSASHMNNNTRLCSFRVFCLCRNVYCQWQLCYLYLILRKNNANKSFYVRAF